MIMSLHMLTNKGGHMNIARTILDGIVMCAVFNAVVGLFFFVFPQAYSTMFPRGMKKAAKPYVKKDEVPIFIVKDKETQQAETSGENKKEEKKNSEKDNEKR